MEEVTSKWAYVYTYCAMWLTVVRYMNGILPCSMFGGECVINRYTAAKKMYFVHFLALLSLFTHECMMYLYFEK
jgi:hypothetical protein